MTCKQFQTRPRWTGCVATDRQTERGRFGRTDGQIDGRGRIGKIQGGTDRTDGRSACSCGYVAGSYNSLGSRARDLPTRASNTHLRRRTQTTNSRTRMYMSSLGVCKSGCISFGDLVFGPPILATCIKEANAHRHTREDVHTHTKISTRAGIFPAWLNGFFCLSRFGTHRPHTQKNIHARGTLPGVVEWEGRAPCREMSHSR